jgi:hypothetical protein
MSSAVDDTDRLDRLLQRYGSDPDIVWVVTRLEPRHSRVKRRDDAIRRALALFPGVPTASARKLAVALGAYFCSGWPAEQHLAFLPTADERHQLLHTILRLNGGRPLGGRQSTIFLKIGKI